MKSYAGSRLAPNSLTLNDLERQDGGFMDFLAISGCDRVTPWNYRYRYAIQIENLVFVY